MRPERYARVRRLFHAARELEPSERMVFLAQACADAPSVQAEVEDYLGAENERSGLTTWTPQRMAAAVDAGAAPADSVIGALQMRTGWTLEVRLRPPEKEAPARAELEAPSRRYELTGEIAAGGVGVVYRGRDRDLGREVAIKVLRPKLRDDPSMVQRFVQEAQICGQLQHPGIVAVHELGLRADGVPFLAMKLIQGQTLAERLRERRAGSGELGRLLLIFDQVCQAVAYAHARGVVHRDLKPSNVMLGAFGEVQVVDWGLAKVLGERSSVGAPEVTTVTDAGGGVSVVGAALGTPAYMAPEQARGMQEDVDERADVFALGAMLCEILTGAPPHDGEAGGVSVDQAARADLRPAYRRLRECAAEPALQRLAIRCLAVERDRRPRSAERVAAAMAQYLVAVETRARKARVRAAAAKQKAAQERIARDREVKSMASVAARVRAVGERRAARLRTAIITLVAVMIGAGVPLGVAWQARERALTGGARLEFELALRQAERLADAEASEARLTEAQTTLVRATRLAGLPIGIAEDQVAHAEQLLADVRVRRAELVAAAARQREVTALRRGLDLLWVPDTVIAGAEQWSVERARELDLAYVDRFRRHEIAVDHRRAADVVARLGGVADSAMAAHFAAWARLRRRALEADRGPPTGDPVHLLEIASALEADAACRDLMRLLVASGGRPEALSAWLERRGVDRLPPASAWLVSAWCDERGDLALATEVAAAACRRAPGDLACLLRLGLAAERSGVAGAPQALSAWSAAAALVPEDPGVRLRLAASLARVGQQEAAVRTLDALLEWRPRDAAALRLRRSWSEPEAEK